MSNDGLGKVRPKRSHGPNKPYERRKSLLGRMSDTVKDLIVPSWISGLVGKSSADHAQREPPGDVAETSEEEQFMSPLQSPPNQTYVRAARDNKVSMNNHGRPGPSNTLSHFPGPSHEITPVLQNSRPARKLETTQTSLGLPQATLQTDSGPTQGGPQTDDNMSDHSDGSKSTSGCSSMIPHPDKREYQREILQLNESSLQKLKDQLMVPGAMTASTPLPSVGRSAPVSDLLRLKKDDTITMSPIAESSANVTLSKTWSTSFQTSRMRDQTAKSKPSFNMSLFGAPGMANTSLFGDSLHESMFYPGKVGYGGASQFKKGKNRSTAPYEIAAPYRTKIQARPVSKPTSDALTSSTAKRILETLERMSTPLTDAKKIPVDIALSDSVLSFTPTSYLKRPRIAGNSSLNRRSSLGFPMRGPPVNQIHTPTIASIAKNRQKLSSSVVDTPPVTQTAAKAATSLSDFGSSHKKDDKTFAPTDNTSEHSSMRRCETVVLPESGRVGGKMKRDKSQHYSSKKQDDDDDVVEVPDLKTDFTLPVVSMPKFNFGSPVPASTPSKPAPVAQTSPMVQAPSPSRGHGAVHSTSSSSMEFTFSNPIPSSKPDHSPASGTPKLNFQFSSPINMDGKDKPHPNKMFSFAGSQEATEPVRKKENNDNFMKPSSELKSGSVTEVLGPMARSDNNFTFDKGKASNFKFGSGFASSGVKGKEGLTNSSDPPSGGFQPASQLKLGSVMDILGGKSVPGSEGPGGFQPANKLKQGSVMDVLSKGAPDSKADETWAKLCAPTDKWECDTCMIRNNAEASVCVACGSAKPSQSATSKPPPGSIASGSVAPAPPGGSLWDQFKPAEGTWECPTCMIQNKATCISCVACATSKPGAQAPTTMSTFTNSSGFGSKFLPPAGSWECDTCMIQNKAQDSLCVACQSPKPGGKSSTGQTGSITMGTSTKNKSGPWQCDTCMISNKEAAVKCISCETTRPGAKSATGGLTFAPNAFSSGSGFKCDTDVSGKDNSSSSGFKFGNVEAKGGISKGGFVFGSTAAVSSSSSSTTTTTTTATTSSSTTSGFMFGNQNSSPAKSGSGFTFGSAPKDSDKSSSAGSSGFTFSSAPKDCDKSSSTGSSGFTFGSAPSKDTDKKDLPSDGFVFGKPSDKVEVSKATTSTSGFTFGTSAGKDSTAVTSSSPSTGGFVFGSGGTTSSTPTQKTDTTPTSVFGHSVQCLASAPTVKSESVAPKVNSTFVFGQSTTTDKTEQDSAKTLNNNTEVKLSQPDNKPATSGFKFGVQNTVAEVKPAFGGFTFKKEEAVPTNQASTTGGFTGFNAVKSTDSSKDQGGSAVKRTSDDADAEPSAKKAFSFSANSSASTTPVFSFNAGSSASNKSAGSSDLFKFGQQPNTSAAPSTAPLGTGGFNSITSGSTAPAFGGSSSVFGGSSSFGGSSATTTSTAFGSNPTPAFGQTTGSAFGSTSTTTTPFGATASENKAFGAGSSQASTGQESSSLFSAKASTFGGSSTPASVFGAANSFGGGTTGSSFGTTDSGSTFGGFNSTPAFGGSSTFGGSSGSAFGSSTPATTATNTPASSGGFNFNASATNFNFGSSTAASSAVFQFGAKADTGPSAATAPQPPQSQTPAFGLPTPAQQPAQAFNFTATPSSFTFNATPSTGEKNQFSMHGSIGGRRIKKAVRKARK